MEGRATIVEVKNLTVRYGGELVLDDISFSVHTGERFMIAGGSGSGKSTLMRHILGLENPEKGLVLIDDTDITQCQDAQLKQVLRNIGVLFQSSALLGSMTIGENVALPILEFTRLPKNAVADMVRMKLSLVGLECYEDHLPSEISGGMKKRAGLARALALNPAILFLDEPSAGLDPITAAEIDDLIQNINESMGTTMIIVTHSLESIFNLGQRLILLEKASRHIIAEGAPLDLQNHSPRPAVRHFFNARGKSGSAGG
ncbi:MAG: ATP-binding cassette domain-containing protein [Desulfosalsimonadaceae bacterium]